MVIDPKEEVDGGMSLRVEALVVLTPSPNGYRALKQPQGSRNAKEDARMVRGRESAM